MFNCKNLSKLTALAFMMILSIVFSAIHCFASELPKGNIDSNSESSPLYSDIVERETGSHYEGAKIGEYIDAWFTSHIYDDNSEQM